MVAVEMMATAVSAAVMTTAEVVAVTSPVTQHLPPLPHSKCACRLQGTPLALAVGVPIVCRCQRRAAAVVALLER